MTKTLRLGALAVLLVSFQILLGALFSGDRSVSGAYLKLLNWDSEHYRRIAELGYLLPSSGQVTSGDIHEFRANVVFFPGYPMIARGIHLLTGLDVAHCLLFLAHSAAILTWFYFLLLLSQLLEEQDESRRVRWMRYGIVAVFAYPCSFFLVTGYTESLFMAGTLGFIYWSERYEKYRTPGIAVLALIHGWILSATRIVGVAVAAFPLIRDFFQRGWRVSSFILFFGSLLGSAGFFLYCQWRFGDWAVYFKLEEIGWHNHRLYFAIINPLSYVPHFFFENTVDSFSRCSVTLSGYLFALLFWTEWKLYQNSRRFAPTRWARSLVAFAMFYIALTGKAAANMDSMMRYTLPVFMLLVLSFTELCMIYRERGEQLLFKGQRGRLKWIAALVISFGIQCWFIFRFTHGRWVA